MNSPLTRNSASQIRTIAMFDGRLCALKFIRKFHVENFEVAKMVLKDVLENKRWTYPDAVADINGVRERISLNI